MPSAGTEFERLPAGARSDELNGGLARWTWWPGWMGPVVERVDRYRKRAVGRITQPWKERVMIADPTGAFKNGDEAENDPRRERGIPAEQTEYLCVWRAGGNVAAFSDPTTQEKTDILPSKRANMP